MPNRREQIENLRNRISQQGTPATARQQQRLEFLRQQQRQNQQQQSARGPTPSARTVARRTGQISDESSAIRADITAAEREAQRQIQLNNPQQMGVFGSRTISYDAQGNPILTDTLSQGQQGILTQDEQLSQMGRQLANQRLMGGGFGQGFDPQLAARRGAEDLGAERQRIENDVFARLTRDLGTQRTQDEERARQSLYDRGIPYSNDPSSRYQQEMRDLNDRYDRITTDARQRATEIGGQEFSRSFGTQEQLIANQLSQAQGIRNQNLGELGALSGLGSGLMLPQFQGFQGANYGIQDPSTLYLAFEALRQQQAQQQGDGRVRGGGQNPAPNPFSGF